jgi:hypothetical protein
MSWLSRKTFWKCQELSRINLESCQDGDSGLRPC